MRAKTMVILALLCVTSCASLRADLTPRQKAWAAIVDGRETLTSTTRFMTMLAKSKKLTLEDAERFETSRAAVKAALDVAEASWMSGESDALQAALDALGAALVSLSNSKLQAVRAPPNETKSKGGSS